MELQTDLPLTLRLRLREQIDCVFARDPAVRTRWEVITLYPGFHAILFHWGAQACWRRGFKWWGRALSQLGRFMTGIEIHPAAQIGRRVFIDHGMGVVIGETAEVGDDCTLYQGVTLGGTTWNKGKRHPTLQPGVVIGAGAMVIGPITLGAGCKVGSNAVVVKPVPAGATVIGIPARALEAEGARQATGTASFAAYGAGKDDRDPLTLAVTELLQANKSLQQQITDLAQRLEQLSGNELLPGRASQTTQEPD